VNVPKHYPSEESAVGISLIASGLFWLFVGPDAQIPNLIATAFVVLGMLGVAVVCGEEHHDLLGVYWAHGPVLTLAAFFDGEMHYSYWIVVAAVMISFLAVLRHIDNLELKPAHPPVRHPHAV